MSQIKSVQDTANINKNYPEILINQSQIITEADSIVNLVSRLSLPEDIKLSIRESLDNIVDLANASRDIIYQDCEEKSNRKNNIIG